MSIRITLLTLLVIGLAVYAWRDWFVALCGLILLMAVIEHPDMPKNIAGIQGLNPWNVLMAVIVLAWLAARRREGLVWDMSAHITVMLLLYLAVIVVGVLRMLADRSHLGQYTTSYLVSETFINCVKWVIPGLLLFDGCRTRKRLNMAIASILGLYVLLAVQVIRWMPASAAVSGDELSYRALKIIQNEIGYSRVNMSMMLSGASWAMLAAVPLVKRPWHRRGLVGLFLLVAYAQALTGGRMGYLTWGVVGLVLCLVRWRRRLVLVPVAVVVICLAVPGAVERMMQGFGETDVAGESATDDAEVTSGRTLIWPYVIEEIRKSPVIGYGRMGMHLCGLSAQVIEGDVAFPHPHNAYLELLLDNGVVGFLLVMPFYVLLLGQAMILFRDHRSPLFEAAGGMTCALMLAFLVAAMGSQTFYPREGALGMWVAMGLTMRLALVRSSMPLPASQVVWRPPRPAFAGVGASRLAELRR